MICPNRECPDLLESGVPGEYIDGISQCPNCGAWLAEPEQYPGLPAPQREDASEFVPEHPEEALATISALHEPPGYDTIETFPSYDLARFAAEQLLAAGFHPVLLAHDLQGLPTFPTQIYTPTRLTVPETEIEDARALLDALDSEGRAEVQDARMTLFDGDITTLPVDAIVNAANEALLGGGGVDGAIHEAAGPGLLAECKTLGGCRPGEAKLTRGYDLPASWVIHTVGPVWRGGEEGEEETLRGCYRACLRIARERGFESLAFPSISTGAFHYPLKEAARIAVEEILLGLKESPDLDVTVVCFSPDVRAAYETALASSR